MLLEGLSRNPKRSGDRLIITEFRGLPLSTRWIESGPTIGAVSKGKVRAVVCPLPVCDELGNVLPTLIVRPFVPVLAVFADMEITGAVGAEIRSLHLDSVKIYLMAAFKAKVVFLFYFWNKHGDNLSLSDPAFKRFYPCRLCVRMSA